MEIAIIQYQLQITKNNFFVNTNSIILGKGLDTQTFILYDHVFEIAGNRRNIKSGINIPVQNCNH